ncbi:pentapeptide repeat-containing protein [Aquimarina sediminis]|uniref:pentapeptide repeat-containing protein n=1 Tax=Aquimarina sediminis TaxID=2070536 RepID=UPI000CA06DBA|nr:pentapeptide repeat-containing protein [Aquimarina sediminis]
MTHKNKGVKSNNEKLILGLVIGAIVGFLIYWSLDIISGFSETIFLILVTVAVVIALIFVILVWFRKRIIKRFFGKEIEFETLLKETQQTIQLVAEHATDQLPIENDKKEKIKFFGPRLVNYILWSNFRNWGLKIMSSFVLGLGGIVTTILVLNQNKLFETQNQKIQDQNKRIEQQTHLAEASRRSSQMFIMGEVLSDLNAELKDSKNKKKVLSSTLTGRIISLSRAMKPYRYLVNDTLIDLPSSPERGQLLISLLKSKIDGTFLEEEILSDSYFASAELERVNLENASLGGASLRNADLSGSDLNHANLAYTNLSNANLEGTNLDDTNLNYANLSRANLHHTILTFADLTNIKSLDSAKVHRYDWIDYIKDSLQLKGADQIFNAYRIDSVYYSKKSIIKMPMILKKQ